jgi:hypothetical protein
VSLCCWKVNLCPSLKYLKRFKRQTGFPQEFPCINAIHHSFNSDQFPSPCRWKTSPQHDAATTMLYWCSPGGIVFSGWWEVLGLCQT